MVVIAIIGILAGALFVSFSAITKSSQKARATEAVSNAKTALESLYLKLNRWPKEILNAHPYGGYRVMDEGVAKVLYKHKVLNVDCQGDREKSVDTYKLRGVDRCGIADPWAQDALRKAKDGSISLNVPSGGTVQDHLIYFAVDQNDDGYVTSAEGAPVRGVRAKAITWCAGADGGLVDCATDKPQKMSANGRTVSNSDNVYSWKRAQEGTP